MTYKDDSRYFDNKAKGTKKCICGHSLAIPVYKEKTLCRWCGRYVYRSELERFKRELEKRLKHE